MKSCKAVVECWEAAGKSTHLLLREVHAVEEGERSCPERLGGRSPMAKNQQTFHKRQRERQLHEKAQRKRERRERRRLGQEPTPDQDALQPPLPSPPAPHVLPGVGPPR